MTKWICKVCGYVYEGDNAPDQCPVCKAPASQFEKVEEKKSKYAGTKTEKNLMEAFAGESQARNKYTYFAEMARKEGLEQIAAIFEETANQEKQQQEKMKNGLTCTNVWLRKQEKKVLKNWQLSLKMLGKLKDLMKPVI